MVWTRTSRSLSELSWNQPGTIWNRKQEITIKGLWVLTDRPRMVLMLLGFVTDSLMSVSNQTFAFYRRQPKSESAVVEPVSTANGPKSHERWLDFGDVPELQRDNDDDGDGQLPVGIHDAQLFQSTRRGGGQWGRLVYVERRSFA